MTNTVTDRRIKYYDIKEVAEMLKVAKPTVYKWCSNNEIPNVKIGGAVRIPIERFHNFLKERDEGPK